jgi:hypothetical protein
MREPTNLYSLTFVVCVSNEIILADNLLASPCLAAGTPHEVIAIHNAPNAAAGLNLGLERAKHPLVVCVHQDVYLPQGWDRQVVSQVRLAERILGPLGVAGVYGVGEVKPSADDRLSCQRTGWVIDRGQLLRDGPALPAAVATLDELLLVLPRGTPLRFDASLGFHLYGADICLQARQQGLAVAALGALCRHNSRSVGLPQAFFPSASRFARKWAPLLPVATPCVLFDRDGPMSLLGKAEQGNGSDAYAQGVPLMAFPLAADA